MPEYLAPGVFVEEVSFRSKSIEGVSTTTTGFIGPVRYGPVIDAPDIITSLAEFERTYGDGQRLAFNADSGLQSHNFVWQAARSFFEEGGKRLYVSRVFRPLSGSYPPADLATSSPGSPPYGDGHARLTVGTSPSFRIVASHPGAAGNLRLRFGLKLGPNVLGALPDPTGTQPFVPTISNLQDGDVVWVSSARAFAGVQPVASPPGPRGVAELPIYVARKATSGAWRFAPGGLVPSPPPANPAADLTLDDFQIDSTPGSGDSIRPLTLALDVLSDDGTRSLGAWSGLPLDPAHRTAGIPDSIFDLFSLGSGNSRNLPIALLKDSVTTGRDLLEALDALPGLDFQLTPAEWDDAGRSGELDALRRKLERGISGVAILQGGNDGLLPGRTEYQGRADPTQDYSTGFRQFESIEDISIVAAPGSTWLYSTRVDDVNAITNLLIAHAEFMRYRIAIIDPPEAQKIADVRKLKAKLDSKYAALYYPWVTVFDPVTRQAINLPPSGFVAGIYARNDTERAVYKAPANEVVRGAIGFETLINTAQQEVLNPEGINCFRFFEGRGFRLWGARTISSDPEWKYVNLRRYFAYLERSIDKGTQWAVFEPNGEALWANVRATIRDFLVNEWANGALLGDKPEKAFFVRCDRSTMTQNDLDNGRLVCLIGVAPLKPAEFVIFRIGQWTADRQS
ncbi:phage tail sheath subtilisin-like domain-containing protein [Accumulibacter sp.]|uniref:phage tail sheath family protein n=1 Tax=Accumulibacter sp. TaxID=2053492 RepID=UPI0025E236CF|nr:phage tail sheath subtilisin-like domain-containing protein [Accumulibacter sp.]MCM8593850.1 phage tail sheath subtilisin-like domain-containing protein [Accumulibacter sp.]MCM8626108.1 phage tail sheath subtilisin-like domain-containing protein [Accumulibacter sp.]MDS4047991.1 phage tail sheath subtilisin-like domain-containing protein [Accumulibacter sp.]